MIEWLEVSKTFFWGGSNSTQVLKPSNLTILEHEFIAILGRSGSGKSTALYLLGLLDQITSGQYKLFGQDVAKLSDNEKAGYRNSRFGFVFQQFMLIPQLNVYDNVALPLAYSSAGVSASVVEECLKSVGMESYMNMMPSQLSGGQQQRVAIARAIVNRPDILLADEPTGSLDSETASQVMQIFKDIHCRLGTTLIMVTHDIAWAKLSGRTITVENGMINA